MKDDREEISEQKKEPWDKRLQDFLNTLQPYILRVQEKRKKWLIINAIGAVLIVVWMLIFANHTMMFQLIYYLIMETKQSYQAD